jgi:hypothetical protein
VAQSIRNAGEADARIIRISAAASD